MVYKHTLATIAALAALGIAQPALSATPAARAKPAIGEHAAKAKQPRMDHHKAMSAAKGDNKMTPKKK